MATLYNGDCFDSMKLMDDKSVDLIFCDLPYGITSCSWDCLIDLDKLWIEFMRIKKLNTPIIMTCTTKFGLSLLNSCPKKCPFRYDLVWCKSASAGFLCAKKMPMRKHEMIYVFYEKLPFYDLSSHTHKFIKERDTKQKNGKIYETDGNNKCMEGKYDPPLPNSLIKDEQMNSELYGELPTTDSYAEKIGINKSDKHKVHYDPPLPNSLIKEDCPDMVMNKDSIYGEIMTENNVKLGGHQKRYDPPLPNSLIKEDCPEPEPETMDTIYGEIDIKKLDIERKDRTSAYDPALPNSLLEIKSTRGKHSTEKPVALMEWILKYYSKEDDIVFDPTMGSGSMGVACGNMNRNFIGIEKDAEIYEVAVNRIEE